MEPKKITVGGKNYVIMEEEDYLKAKRGIAYNEVLEASNITFGDKKHEFL